MTPFTWSDLIQNHEIHIPEALWLALNAQLDQAAIIYLLGQAIDHGGLPLPLKDITAEEAQEDFYRLCRFDPATITTTGPWNTRFIRPPQWPLTQAYYDIDYTGLTSSNFYHQQTRMTCDGRGYPSPMRTWADPKLRVGLLKALWTMKYTRVTSAELRRAMEVRKYVASQFRPTVAKAVFDRFLPPTGGRVLDLSAGWGDRLSAALATERVAHYTGIDPNQQLHPGYAAQVQAFNHPNRVDGPLMELFGPTPTTPPKTIDLICTPAEDVTLPP